MENITISQISTFLALIVGILGSVKYLSNELQKYLEKTLKPINESIKDLDISQCKNFLVSFLEDIENDENIDTARKERAYELYDHYTNDLKQNSYIHKRWEELMEKEK